MLTREGYSVRSVDQHRHKYSDAIAEWLDYHPDHEDESTGDVESPTGYVARFGRTLLVTDSRGFVDRDTYRTEQEARERYTDCEENYTLWQSGGYAAEVCEDCYFAHHYGAHEYNGQWFAGESDTASERKPLGLIADDADVLDWTDSETGRGIDTFSMNRCAGCGSALGGARYRLLIVPTDADAAN